MCEESGTCEESHHTVIKLSKRDDELARRIARDYGLEVKGRPFLDSHYFLAHPEHHDSRKKRSVVQQLTDHPDVEMVSEQRPRKRTKRDFLAGEEEPRPRRQVINHSNGRSNTVEIPRLPFQDPLYRDQWYLVGGAVGGFDMNVREAWLLGYAGRNVSISILDDGIQRDHLDLAANYDPLASTDINDHDDDPTPQNNGDNKHGTRCAGEVSAIAGNNVCGVGVAFHSKIGGVRMLDGPVSDSVEAASLNLNQNHIDIYSASWGPEDDGKTFDGPGPLAREAFYRGIKEGRGGKGNIFVWASGNGGSRQDSCSADGYTTSIYTLSISSATFDNRRPWYLEECPSTIASTYSSANINQPAIVTVDVPAGCTKMHTGTSASAPLAAGIIALALEANPQLTWRDMQHIVLRTANPTPLLNNPGWSVNGVGRRISNKFGYGLMDAGAIVRLAKVWQTVPDQHMCTYEYTLSPPNPRPITGRFQMNYTLQVSGCERGTPVLYLEHVQVLATVRFGKRGDLKLTLFSPSGTRSVLLPPRPQDYNQNGFHKWPFLSVQMWGEDPRGTWTLMVESVSSNPQTGGTFGDWTLLLYGTQDPAQPTDPKYSPLQPSYPRSQNIVQSITSEISIPMLLVALQVTVLVLVLLAAIFACRRVFCVPAYPTDQPPSSPSTADVMALNGLCRSTSQSDTEAGLVKDADDKEVQHTESEPTISFGDLRSAGNCHEECESGCSESKSATGCFACKHFTQTLRNRAGFKCVPHCDDGFYLEEPDKCKACSPNCQSCKKPEVCETCPGAKLLIDVDHYGHFDHGQCVDKCPEGLIADYDSNRIQARCVLKKNPCANGYYQDLRGNCAVCDPACAICHGAGPLQCDKCSEGYSNYSIGYCRPCCAKGQTPSQDHCDDCSANPPKIAFSPMQQPSMLVPIFIVLITLGIFCCGYMLFSYVCPDCCGGGRSKDVEYTPLKTNDGKHDAPFDYSSDSDLEETQLSHPSKQTQLALEEALLEERA